MHSCIIKPETGYFSIPKQCHMDSTGITVPKPKSCFLTNDMALREHGNCLYFSDKLIHPAFLNSRATQVKKRFFYFYRQFCHMLECNIESYDIPAPD